MIEDLKQGVSRKRMFYKLKNQKDDDVKAADKGFWDGYSPTHESGNDLKEATRPSVVVPPVPTLLPESFDEGGHCDEDIAEQLRIRSLRRRKGELKRAFRQQPNNSTPITRSTI